MNIIAINLKMTSSLDLTPGQFLVIIIAFFAFAFKLVTDLLDSKAEDYSLSGTDLDMLEKDKPVDLEEKDDSDDFDTKGTEWTVTQEDRDKIEKYIYSLKGTSAFQVNVQHGGFLTQIELLKDFKIVWLPSGWFQVVYQCNH